VIHTLYTIFKRSSVEERVAFLSRQSEAASLDFTLLEAALRNALPGWEFATSCYRDTGSFISRVRGTLRQLKLVATSRLCIVDGYTPAVSIPQIDPSTIVVQLWHALGTFKRFGWQAIDTPAGRTKAQAEGLRMHCNYSVIIAGGEGPRAAYAQAFGYPEDRIIPLGMPRMDYLLDDTNLEQYPQLADGRINILFAPTFRREIGGVDVQRHLQELADRLPREMCNLVVSFHPFSRHNGEAIASSSSSSDECVPIVHIPRAKGIDLLKIADYVITDYSAIAFEAALLHRKVLFYVPDIDAYRLSPGLNIDPEKQFPTISFRDVASLANYIQDDIREEIYAGSGFWSYGDEYLAQPARGATERMVEHLQGMIA
jgi:CDP-ribitol ribitolphosphotransferase